VNAPAIVIRLSFEARPRVYVDAIHESDESRLAEWLESQPQYAELVARALELERKEPAA
jgi:hypothetical protein